MALLFMPLACSTLTHTSLWGIEKKTFSQAQPKLRKLQVWDNSVQNERASENPRVLLSWLRLMLFGGDSLFSRASKHIDCSWLNLQVASQTDGPDLLESIRHKFDQNNVSTQKSNVSSAALFPGFEAHLVIKRPPSGPSDTSRFCEPNNQICSSH